MSVSLASESARIPQPPLPADLVSEAAEMLDFFGYGPELCDAQDHDRDLWGPAAVLLRTRRVALREVPSS